MSVTFNKENFFQSAGFVLTLIIISAFSVHSAMKTVSGISEQENRQLEPFPKIHTLRKDLPSFPSAFEHFFCDRVAFRLSLISLRNLLCFKIFRSSGNPRVVIGKDNWLFYNSYGVLPAQLNLSCFNDLELQSWFDVLVARKNFLQKRGVKYVVVFPPEKGTIYPERLPGGWTRNLGGSRLDQIQNALSHSDVDFVDAKKLLATEKLSGHKTYHSNDSHWNQRSAFLVAQEILRHVHVSVPAVDAVSPELLLDGRDQFVGDLSKMLGLQTVFLDQSPSIVVNSAPHAIPVKNIQFLAKMDSISPPMATTVDNGALPRALVLRDSFCTYLVNPLSEHFKFCEFQWTNHFQPAAILSERPDVVIDEIAERHLYEEFSEHVPDIQLGAKSASIPCCAFGNKIDLMGVEVESNCRGKILKIHWRSKDSLILDYKVGIHCLSGDDKIVGGVTYAPDILARTLDACCNWTDTVELPNREIKDAAKIGIIILDKNSETLSCSKSNGSWDRRYVILLDGATERNRLAVGGMGRRSTAL